MARGKVITTHLRTGDPNGIRTVFISNKICEMIAFPKSEFEMVSKMEESSRPALYILLGEDENGSAQAYIGESTNGVKRNAIIAAMSKPAKDGFWELQRDYVLASPSTAASYCSGRSCSGWIHWINDEGQSLDELYRSE